MDEPQTTFDWDENNTKHLAAHDVSREEFEEVFDFPRLQVEQERKRESRFWVLGRTAAGRLLTVVYTMREGMIRAVTAHTMKRKNRSLYEQSIETQD